MIDEKGEIINLNGRGAVIEDIDGKVYFINTVIPVYKGHWKAYACSKCVDYSSNGENDTPPL